MLPETQRCVFLLVFGRNVDEHRLEYVVLANQIDIVLHWHYSRIEDRQCGYCSMICWQLATPKWPPPRQKPETAAFCCVLCPASRVTVRTACIFLVSP